MKDRINIVPIVTGVILIGLIGIAMMFVGENYRKHIELIQTAYDQNYTTYYNGKEVDINKFDIELYSGRIDVEKKIVYITDKK